MAYQNVRISKLFAAESKIANREKTGWNRVFRPQSWELCRATPELTIAVELAAIGLATTISVPSMGSGRYARFCRSPHRPATSTSRSDLIHCACQRGRDVMPPSGLRCGADSNLTSACREWARSGELQRDRFDVALHNHRPDAGDGPGRRYPRQAAAHDAKRPLGPCPSDPFNRQLRAPVPDMLWSSDYTFVTIWAGFVDVAFVIETFTRRIVDGRASRTAHAAPSATHWHRTDGRQRRRQPRHRFSRHDQLPLKSRGDPWAWPMAVAQGRRIYHARMGRLVQSSAAARTYRQHPAR